MDVVEKFLAATERRDIYQLIILGKRSECGRIFWHLPIVDAEKVSEQGSAEVDGQVHALAYARSNEIMEGSLFVIGPSESMFLLTTSTTRRGSSRRRR